MMIPSRFEPCGLIQLHAMQYGTVPLVSTTGGLVDTVKDGVTGFHLGKMDPDKLLNKDAQAVAQGMIRCCLDQGALLLCYHSTVVSAHGCARLLLFAVPSWVSSAKCHQSHAEMERSVVNPGTSGCPT